MSDTETRKNLVLAFESYGKADAILDAARAVVREALADYDERTVGKLEARLADLYDAVGTLQGHVGDLMMARARLAAVERPVRARTGTTQHPDTGTLDITETRVAANDAYHSLEPSPAPRTERQELLAEISDVNPMIAELRALVEGIRRGRRGDHSQPCPLCGAYMANEQEAPSPAPRGPSEADHETAAAVMAELIHFNNSRRVRRFLGFETPCDDTRKGSEVCESCREIGAEIVRRFYAHPRMRPAAIERTAAERAVRAFAEALRTGALEVDLLETTWPEVAERFLAERSDP